MTKVYIAFALNPVKEEFITVTAGEDEDIVNNALNDFLEENPGTTGVLLEFFDADLSKKLYAWLIKNNVSEIDASQIIMNTAKGMLDSISKPLLDP